MRGAGVADDEGCRAAVRAGLTCEVAVGATFIMRQGCTWFAAVRGSSTTAHCPYTTAAYLDQQYVHALSLPIKATNDHEA
jgi:hypothetical protein